MSVLEGHGAGALADRETPLIRNCWYFAALGRDVGRQLIGRTIVETKVLLYRTDSGEAVALHDRCPHRSYPLSLGRLEGDQVVCGYHGMRFGPDGICNRVPGDRDVSSGKIGIERYPLVARGPMLWVWVGEANKADEALIPDYGWLKSPDWIWRTGGVEIAASYVAMHENLLDLTHFTYLHGDTVGTPEYAKSPLEVVRDGDTVRVFRKLLNHEPPAAFASLMGLAGKKVNRFSESGFLSPGASGGQGWFEDPAPEPGARNAFHVRFAHIATPITRHKFAYQWFVGRDFALRNEDATEALTRAANSAFLEDVGALQAIEQVSAVEIRPFRELSFASDKAGIEMRRILRRMAIRERRPDEPTRDVAA